MKKILSLVLLVTGSLFLTGCNVSDESLNELYSKIEDRSDVVIEFSSNNVIDTDEYSGEVTVTTIEKFSGDYYYVLTKESHKYEGKEGTDEADVPSTKEVYSEEYYNFNANERYYRESDEEVFSKSYSYATKDSKYRLSTVVIILNTYFEKDNSYLSKFDVVSSTGFITNGKFKSLTSNTAKISCTTEYIVKNSKTGVYNTSKEKTSIEMNFKTETITMPQITN